MPRRARSYIAGMPYHIVQRGNNREACFMQPGDYEYYLELWRKYSKRYHVAVHAYCLMTNHIHFIASPSSEKGLSTTIKDIASRYAYYINKTYKRTGTLWEGRHRSSLIDSTNYLLACYRYVELNPVRAGMVSSPEEYVWSSYGVNAWGDDAWLEPHSEYLDLGQSVGQRCSHYRELFLDALELDELSLFRKAAHYCQPIGGEQFCRQIEEKYGLKPGFMRRGRPPKSVA